MRELLVRWAKLEPDQCRAKAADDVVFVDAPGIGPLMFTGDGSPHAQLHVQGAVQAAIEAHGMAWSIDFVNGHGDYRATVDESESGGEPTAAAALLAAYLDALEAA